MFRMMTESPPSPPIGAVPEVSSPRPEHPLARDEKRSSKRVSLGYALAGVVTTGLYLALWHTGAAGNALYDLTGLSAVVAIGIGVRLNRPRLAVAWRLVALGLLLFVAGDVTWAFYELVLKVPVPFPSWGDALYLAGYPAIAAGVVLFTRERSSGRDRAALIDAAIVATSAGIYAWLFLMEPYALDQSLPLSQRLVSIAYPLGDLVVLAVAARLALSVGRRSLAYVVLLLSFMLMLAADARYGVEALAGTYSAGAFMTDGFYMLSYLLAGCAALHPSMTTITQPEEVARSRPTRLPLLILALALLLMPAALGIQLTLGQSPEVLVVMSGSFVLAVLILTRMTGLLGQLERRLTQVKEQEGALRAALSERETLSERLKHQAFHDPLTGVPNRLLLADRVDHAIARAERTGERLSVLFLDLDNFKSVNDALGHAAGDSLLKGVAERLGRCLRPADTIARIGGDEFAVLLESASNEDSAEVAQRILEELSLPFPIGDDLVGVHTSIGIAMGVGSINSENGAGDLLQQADLAMYEAKRRGKDRYEFFEADLQTAALQRHHLQADLQRAMEQGELVVHYQPIVELKSARILAVEALVRWLHPNEGLIGPQHFIPVAEETGLIYDLDRHVVKEALRQTALWRRQIDPELKVSVNFSAASLDRPSLLDYVQQLLHEYSLQGDALTLEITETALLHHSEALLERLRALRALGIAIALDDFGTGFSSLTHLRRLPIDVLKVGRSLIEDVTRSDRAATLAQIVHSMGPQLGLLTVAEGVEAQEQAAVLRAAGCHLAQGYLFARPSPPEDIEKMLAGRIPVVNDRDWAAFTS